MKSSVNVLSQEIEENWAAYNGDSTEVLRGVPDESVGLIVYSPPFLSLYTYSNSERDMGNCKSDDEFWTHFDFICRELYRVLKPGRIMAFHCMVVPAMKERDGYIGLKDFRGDMIRFCKDRGFIHHSEHCIRKDPLIEATRTKAIGLMHKQLCKDSAMSRAGIPDYLIAMRKPGVNPDPIAHTNGQDHWIGLNPPKEGNLSHERWRRYADPIWDDIDQSNTLNGTPAREDQDERHVCPLQLDVIERAVWLWSNPDDVVLSPYMGIGSEGFVSLKMGRRFIGCELKRSYFDLAVKNLRHAANMANIQDSLFAGEVSVEG